MPTFYADPADDNRTRAHQRAHTAARRLASRRAALDGTPWLIAQDRHGAWRTEPAGSPSGRLLQRFHVPEIITP